MNFVWVYRNLSIIIIIIILEMFSTIFYLIFLYYKYLLIRRKKKLKLIWFFIQTESQLAPCIFLLFILLQSSIKNIYKARERALWRKRKIFHEKSEFIDLILAFFEKYFHRYWIKHDEWREFLVIVTNEKCELIPVSRFSINFYPIKLTSSFLRIIREREIKKDLIT